MRNKRLIALPLTIALALPLLVSGGIAAAAEQQDRSDWFVQPRTVGEDPEGDWGEDVDPALSQVGHYLGQDLVEAQIGMEDRSTLNFILKLAYLPPWGGWPELTRYTWDFTVNGEERQIDGKWMNYTRGACDPTSGQCPPPRDPGMQPFILRGDCELLQIGVTTFRACQELAVIQAIFDPDEATITIPVPLEALEPKRRARIAGGQNTFAGSISAAPSAFATYGAFPMDTMVMDKVFRLPRGARP
jgi:hypothetical protein